MAVDKQLHFFSGGMLGGLLYPLGLPLGLLILIVVAVSKEVRDSLGYGTPEVLDAIATIAGGALVLFWLHLTI
jgi:hypothetical protein